MSIISTYRVDENNVAAMFEKALMFCLHVQNAWTNFHDFWHTSMPFYSEHICCKIYDTSVAWQKL